MTDAQTQQPEKPKMSPKKKAILAIAIILLLVGIDHVTTKIVSGKEPVATADSIGIVAPAADTVKAIAPLRADTVKKDTTKKK